MKHINIFAIIAFAMGMCSCSFLEEDTSSLSTPDNFFRKYSECQTTVNGCYIPLKSIYTYTYMLATECATDLAYCASGTYDARLDISPAIPRFGQTVWTNCYLGVQRCNFAIQGIAGSKSITEDQRNELLCETKALRGFYYWTLTSFFGNVPFYFDDVTDKETLNRIALLPRMDAVKTRDAVIDDLLEVAGKVPQIRTSDNDGCRLGAAAAYMIIAECAMWNKKYEIALDALKKIESIYGSLSSYDYTYNVMFRNPNTPESILEIQHTYSQDGLKYYSNVSCICMPYPRTNNTCTYDGVDIPELGDQATAWSGMHPNLFFCQGIQAKMSKDLRKTVNMAWDYNGKAFASVGGRPWMGPKFWCPNQQGTADGNNYKVFRYANALLLMAECYCELNQFDKAVEYLNFTRVRAGIGPYTFRTQARLRDEIRSERGRELIGEFQRKFDLVRWGIWYSAVCDNNDYAALKDNIKPCHEYYPIPDKEVVYSKYALDNKEYEKYGL